MSLGTTNQRYSRTLNKASFFPKVLPLIPAFFLSFAGPARAQALDARMALVSDALDQFEYRGPSFEAAPVVVSSNVETVRYGSDELHAVNQDAPPAVFEQDVYREAARQYEGKRDQAMESTMRFFQMDITLEYLFSDGKQQFVVINPDGSNLSRLKYPNEGRIPVVKGEVKAGRFALGGRLGGIALDRENSTDEDWGLPFDIDNDGMDEPTDYNIATQSTKSSVRFWDANLYYTLLDNLSPEQEARQIWLLDRFSLDIFGGYQWFRGRYAMVDPEESFFILADDQWYYDAGLPANEGLDSPYKITYQGPRGGLRVTGVKGRVTTKLSVALAHLKTKAHGYWNLRDYNFWQYGKDGFGVDIQAESTYALTRHWSLGIGYDFFGLYQKKMKETGILPGSEYYDEDMIRDANNQVYGVSLLLKYIW